MTQEIAWHNGKAYACCNDCGKLVQLNKPFVGGLHICAGQEN